MTSRYSLPFRDADIVVDAVGDGSVVGYLHGGVGNPGVHPFLTSLAAHDRRVVAPSLPGFTGSAPCPDIRSLYDWVVVTSETLDVAGLAGCPVVASSVGAMLALELAAVRPEAFASLVLIAPFGLWDPGDPTADPFARTLSGQRSILTADAMATSQFFDDQPDRAAVDLIEDNVARYSSRTSFASLIWPIPEFGLSTRLHRVTCPVTLVWGSDDRVIPVSYLERFANALPNVVGTHVVSGAGHLVEWDAPDAVAELVVTAPFYDR